MFLMKNIPTFLIHAFIKLERDISYYYNLALINIFLGGPNGLYNEQGISLEYFLCVSFT